VTDERSTNYQGVSSGKVGISAHSASSYAMECYIDYIRLRKYTSSEPGVSVNSQTEKF